MIKQYGLSVIRKFNNKKIKVQILYKEKDKIDVPAYDKSTPQK